MILLLPATIGAIFDDSRTFAHPASVGCDFLYHAAILSSLTWQPLSKMFATIGAWCIALFFLWYGLAAFVSALNTDMFKKIGAVLALVGGVVSLLGLLGM